jgi:hypothetical protein
MPSDIIYSIIGGTGFAVFIYSVIMFWAHSLSGPSTE